MPVLPSTVGVRVRPRLGLLCALGALLFLPAAAPAAGPNRLPGDFHWGVAGSAFQSEGTTPRDELEHLHRSSDSTKAPYGEAVDFFHRYRSDIRRAAELGVDTFRISINWARVEPHPGSSPSADCGSTTRSSTRWPRTASGRW